MFSMTKSREFDEKQRQDAYVNKCHYGEDVKFYHYFLLGSNISAANNVLVELTIVLVNVK